MLKTKRPIRILGLDPGTRFWGWALLENEELHEHGVKTLKTKGSPKQRLIEARKVFFRLLTDYGPQILIIEKPFLFWSKQSHLLNVIIKEIKDCAKKRRIKVYSLSPRTVKKIICKDGNASKKDMAKILAAIFPDLNIHLNQNRRYKEVYWGHCFDAIGLGLCWWEKTASSKI